MNKKVMTGRKREVDQSVRILNDMDMKGLNVKILYGIIYLIVIMFCLVMTLPVIWTIASAAKDIDEFYRIPPTIIPQSFHPEKFLEVWREFNLARNYIYTAYVVGIAVAISITSNGLMAYSLSRLKPAGSKFIFNMLYITMMLPGLASLAAQMKIVVDFPILHVNLMNTPWTMWIMAGCNVFTVIWFKGYFDGIPTSIIESAKLDGASTLRIFAQIVLPMAKPVILTQALLKINAGWADYFWPMIVLKEKNHQTVMVRALALQGSLSVDKKLILMTLIMVPVMIFFAVFQKYIMGNATMGGVKE